MLPWQNVHSNGDANLLMFSAHTNYHVPYFLLVYWHFLFNTEHQGKLMMIVICFCKWSFMKYLIPRCRFRNHSYYHPTSRRQLSAQDYTAVLPVLTGIQPTRLPNGRPQIESHQCITLKTLGDISVRSCGNQTVRYFSQPVEIPICFVIV